MAGGASRRPPERADRQRQQYIWPLIIAALVCFILGFTFVRVISGPTSNQSANPTPTPASTTASAATATETMAPGDYGDVAPRDLRIVQRTADAVVLQWTPPKNRDALIVLYRSVSDDEWEQVDLDLQGVNGRVTVPVTSSGGRYCFLLLVVVGTTRGFTSNSVCLDGSDG